MKYVFSALFVTLLSFNLNAQLVPVDDRGQPSKSNERGRTIPTSKKAADQYMNRETHGSAPARSSGGEDRFLSLHIGPYIDSDIHRWGAKSADNEGLGVLGVTYRVGEWSYSSDLMFRASFDFVEINNDNTSKLSLMPIFSFPDARSDFPLYFGAGIGLGVFLNQVEDESKLSFDYTILAGMRFFNVIGNVGFMGEIGLNNHVFLTSTGQFSGTYFALGTVFEF